MYEFQIEISYLERH